MGTSGSYGGPGTGTPLVPSWLEPADGSIPKKSDSPEAPADNGTEGISVPPAPPVLPPIPPAGTADRFTAARSNFSRFAGSGGHDHSSLGRAISSYVSTSSGGARQATRRMGASRQSGARLLSFLSDAVANGAQQALRALDLDALVGHPIEEVFLGLTDYVCPDGGTVDEGIAREAWIETIADLAQSGITDLDSMTVDQMQTIFEMYATHAIEARICNDIGAKSIMLPTNVRQAAQVQAQIYDFIRRGVADAITTARLESRSLAPDRVLGYVTDIYQQAFSILKSLSDAEARS